MGGVLMGGVVGGLLTGCNGWGVDGGVVGGVLIGV